MVKKVQNMIERGSINNFLSWIGCSVFCVLVLVDLEINAQGGEE